MTSLSSTNASAQFDFEHTVNADELDFLGHVNNKTYLGWMEMVAWEHAQSVGITHQLQRQLNRIMAVYEHTMHYHASCYKDETLIISTWIQAPDSYCRRRRFFKMTRKHDNKCVFSAESVYVCSDMNKHKPKRIPNEYTLPYFN